MKKRILSIMLLCCMVLTMLPTTVLAADGPMDTIPKYDVSIDVYNRTSDISIKDSRSYYIYSSVPDKLRDTWAWDKKIFIKGDKTAPHVFIDGVNIKMSPSSLGPAIELNKKASAYIYFIGKNSSLQGADGRAAIQKNRSEGQLYVLARTGTTVTCKGGDKAAGIGGSYATRNISNGYYNGDMYGHGVNMHFGSRSNPDYWGGTIVADGGNGGAGIGGGQGGAGEKLYFYSGTIQATSDRFASGIGGSYEGRGSEIYIYGGTVSAQGGEGGAGIGGGCWKTEQDMNGINAAHDIYISGGTVTAKGGYNGAGIGGGQYVPARNITVTGGVVTATGHYGAAIGGGRWCRGMDITLTDATLNLSTNYRSNGSDAAAVGYGDIVYKPEQLVADPSIATNDRIKVGSKDGKIVMLTANGHALRTDGKPSYFMHLTDFLIPDSDGMIDLSLLTLPYTQNYGWAITDLDVKMMETSCEGNHTYGWKDWNGCHVWGCTRCPARDPLKSGPAPDGEHIPGEWESQEKKCTVCGHKLMKDTTPPVIEGITNGMEYTAEDTDDGQPGTISFTVSDPVRDKEVSSGVKSVTINGEEQTAQTGQAYQLTAPDGGNNDEGFVYEVVATDNAGNSTTTTIRLYRRHRVLILSDRNDPSSTIFHLGVPHGSELELPFDHLPKEAYFVDWDNEDIKISRGENNDYNFGIINSNRMFLQVIPETELPTLELGLRSRRFWGYHADSESDFCYADMPSKTEEGYLMDIRVTSNKIGYYFGSPVRYTQEQLKALDAEGKIKWTQFDTTSLLTFDVIPYEEYNGSWYYYAKATNEVGTRYVSTPNIIIDADPAVALEYPSGKELTGKYGQTESGTYWGDLQFTVVDESEFTVKDGSTPLEPDENGVYTIKADMDEGIKHEIVIMDAGNNRTAYINEIRMNTLDRRDNPSALNLPNGANLEESLPKTVRILTARDSSMFTNIPVIWEIPETYEQASKREQSFTVNGTLDLSGTDIVLHPDKTELGKAQISVTIAGAPHYTLTIADSANGSITVVNATETAEDGKPLFFKDELVMLSIAPDEGYMLSALSVNGIPATVAVGDDTYTFAQPEENVTITATFEKRNEHTVTFDANGGSEPEDLPEEVTTAMPAKKVLHGSEYYLPECEFVAPEGKQFKAWQIDGTEYPVNAPVTVTADITVKALWEDAPPAHVEYTITVKTDGNGTASASHVKAVVGTEITLTATPDTGYHFKEWQVMRGNVTIKDDKFTMPDSDVEVKAIFEEDTPPAPTEHTVTVTSGGNGTASASPAKAVAGAEITLTATPNTGYHFKEWQVISGNVTIKDDKFLMPDSNVEVKAIFEEDAPPAPTEFTITVKTDGNGTASASPAKAVAGTEITLTAMPNEGYHFKEWQVISGDVTIKDDKFTMPEGNVEIKAIFEEDTPPAPTDPAKPSIGVTGTYTYNGSVHTAAVSGYVPATMDISGNTATDAGDYTVSVTSKTGKWADGSTDAVTAAWRIGKATQEAPNGLTGVAPTTEGGSDGKITGVDATMEYRVESETIYTACTGIEIENLPAGNYFVRYAEDHNHFASPDAEITVGEGAPLADCTITFNAGGGSGSMEPVTVKAGTNYILPACGFTAPADQEFKAWEISGTEYKVGDSYTVNGDIKIKALWKNSVITPTTYTVTVSNDGNGTGTATPSTAATGTEITLTAMPKEGYHFKEWQVISGGVTIKNNKFTMPDTNVAIKAIFEEDAPPAPTEFTITVKTDGNGTASASHAKAVVGTEITLTAKPNKGYHFKEWEVISGGVTIKNNKFIMPSANVEVKAIFEEDTPPAPTEHTVTVTSDGNGTASASPAKAAAGAEITLSATPDKGYHLKEWQVMRGNVTIKDDKFTMPDNNVEVKAIFEEDTPPAPTEHTVTVTSGGNGTASASPAKAVAGAEITLSATPDRGYHLKEWQVESPAGLVITNNKFTMPGTNVAIKAIFEEDTPPAPTEHTVTVTSGGNGTASASPAKAVAGAEITLSATPDRGYHLKEWQVESPAGLVITNNKFTMPGTNVAIKAIFEEDAPPAPTEFTITVKTDGNGTTSASHAKAVVGTEITLTAKPNKGYHFKEWEVISGGVTIKNNKFIMPSANVEVKAIFEEDVPALQYKDADKTTPAPAATATPAPVATATPQYTIPQTGDTSNPALLVVLMLVSGSAAIGTAVVASKKKHNR